MNLEQAHAAGVQAAQACLSATERSQATFGYDAAEHIVTLLKAMGPTSGETLTDLCKEAGIAPRDDRAFGNVYRDLAKAGRIRRTGSALRRKGNSTGGASVWEAV